VTTKKFVRFIEPDFSGQKQDSVLKCTLFLYISKHVGYHVRTWEYIFHAPSTIG